MKWNFRKFDTALVVCALLTVVVLAGGGMSVRSQDKNLIANKWKYSPNPRAFIESGAGGVEFGESAWLNGEELVVVVVNPSIERSEMRLQLHLGKSPCGELPELALTPKSEGDVKLGSQPDEYVVAVGAKQAKVISFGVSGSRCAVKGDPRLFIGSIATPAITSWTNQK